MRENEKYKCLIIDDEELARDLIAAHLQQLDQFEVVGFCASAIEASKLLSQHKIDLMFLDIEMPVLKGTDFYKNLSLKPKVIFTTAYRDYAVDGFDLEAVDYLLKPITFARFFKAIERFLATQEVNIPVNESVTAIKHAKDYIFVRSNRKDVKLKFSEILYAQSLKDYITIYTQEKNYIVKESMTSFTKRLSQSFVRVHRSYVINQMHMTAYTKYDVEIGDIEVPIGETYRQSFLECMA